MLNKIRRNPGKVILIILFSILIGIQFIPVERDNPPVTQEIEVPAEVMAIFKEKCWDCHSNETVWPWYSSFAPGSLLVAYDVHEGREELNFSEWDKYDTKKQLHKIEETFEEVEEGKMPIKGYLAVHSEAAITPDELTIIKAWALSIGAIN